MFIIRDRETGTYIDMFNTREKAERQLAAFEEEDKRDGTYEEDFYEIYEEEQQIMYSIILIHWRNKEIAYTEGIDDVKDPITAEDAAYKYRNEICIDYRDDAVTIEVYNPDSDTADNFTLLKGLPIWQNA